MRIESYIVAEMLQRMAQQSLVIRSYSLELATALGGDEYLAALHAAAELHRDLGVFATTRTMLQDHVVRHDGLGAVGKSFAELALRARGLVILGQLDLVRDALDDPTVHACAAPWFSGRFHDISEIAAFLRDRLAQIHAIWTPHRQGRPQPPGMTEPDRASNYRTALRVAQRALCELRDEPDLARFLDHGLTATQVSELHLPCKRIDAMLALDLDMDPAQPSARKARSTRTTSGIAERP